MGESSLFCRGKNRKGGHFDPKTGPERVWRDFWAVRAQIGAIWAATHSTPPMSSQRTSETPDPASSGASPSANPDSSSAPKVRRSSRRRPRNVDYTSLHRGTSTGSSKRRRRGSSGSGLASEGSSPALAGGPARSQSRSRSGSRKRKANSLNMPSGGRGSESGGGGGSSCGAPADRRQRGSAARPARPPRPVVWQNALTPSLPLTSHADISKMTVYVVPKGCRFDAASRPATRRDRACVECPQCRLLLAPVSAAARQHIRGWFCPTCLRFWRTNDEWGLLTDEAAAASRVNAAFSATRYRSGGRA